MDAMLERGKSRTLGSKRLQDKQDLPRATSGEQRSRELPQSCPMAQQSPWQGRLCSVSAACLGLFPSLGTFPLLFCRIKGAISAGEFRAAVWLSGPSALSLMAAASMNPSYPGMQAPLFTPRGQHATPKGSKVYQIHCSAGVLVCNDFGSAKPSFSAPPSSCSSVSARGNGTHCSEVTNKWMPAAVLTWTPGSACSSGESWARTARFQQD